MMRASRRIRALVDKMGAANPSPFSHVAAREPLYPGEEIYGIFSSDPAKQYDMHEIIARIVDASEFEEYRPEYGETVLCGYARIGGWAVGIVANQKKHVQTTARGSDQKRIEFGGVIYTESAEKAARFILDCNQNRIPLVFLHDVNGFMVGKDAEWSGIIRAGAKMVNAVANSVVPKITVICGGSFGAGNYAMCGKAYDPRFMFAWPTAKFAVMSGDAAANTLVEIKLKQLEREGKKVDEKARKEMLRKRQSHLRTPNRPALRRRPPLGRRHHRSRPYPRRPNQRPRSRRPQSRYPRIQNGCFANLNRLRGLWILLLGILLLFGSLVEFDRRAKEENATLQRAGWNLFAEPTYLEEGAALAGLVSAIGGIALLIIDSVGPRRRQIL